MLDNLDQDLSMVNPKDGRGLTVHPSWSTTPQKQRDSFLWRFWQKVPILGHISFFYQSCYTYVLEDHLSERVLKSQMLRMMELLKTFEPQIVDDRTASAQLRIHLSRKELKHRLKKYADDPLQSWRVPRKTGSKKNVSIGSVWELRRGG